MDGMRGMVAATGGGRFGGVIAVDDPLAPDVRELLERHLAYARGASPPEDAHALDVEALRDPQITFFSHREDGRVLAVGALRRLDDRHGEIKSMHTSAEARGRGIGMAMLEHLLRTAREMGLERVSLETGTQPAFAAARALYARAGFEPCAPFGDYRESPNSAYMTLRLTAEDRPWPAERGPGSAAEDRPSPAGRAPGSAAEDRP
jgi:putative acetyltransferase